MPDPAPGPGELRIRIAASGINPGDIRKRQDDFGYGMAYPRVIPHSDGAGKVDQVEEFARAARREDCRRFFLEQRGHVPAVGLLSKFKVLIENE